MNERLRSELAELDAETQALVSELIAAVAGRPLVVAYAAVGGIWRLLDETMASATQESSRWPVRIER